ncbi:MAG: hypothetical protein H7A46_22870 [Verrucomicrobiales bacterium]|nr:hypothetical protein [Verrucomicrobiales bacterium]
MQLDEATLVRLMRRVVRRAYILATAGCVGLFFISCFRPVRGGFATDAWLMVAMSAGFAVAFILIWGGGPLAAMADERRFGDAGSWLRQFRNLAGLLVVLQVVGAVLSAAHESRFIPWFRTGLMGVRVLMGVFWLAQALDCHRALTMAALGSPREGGANSAGRPNLPGIYVVCLLLGTWTSWAVNHAAGAEGQGVVFGVPMIACVYWGAVLALHRRLQLGAVAWLAFAAAAMGCVQTLGWHVHTELRVPSMFLAGSGEEAVAHARMLEVRAVRAAASAAMFGLILLAVQARPPERSRPAGRGVARWLCALLALAVSAGHLWWIQTNPAFKEGRWIPLAHGVLFGVAFVATLALGTRRSGRENSLILGAMVCVVLAGHVPTQWIDPLQERWGYFAGLGFTWGLGLLADLPLIALFWLALRRSEAAPDRL